MPEEVTMRQFSCSVSSGDEAVDFFSAHNLYHSFTQPEFMAEHLDFLISRQPANSGYRLEYDDYSGQDPAIVYGEKTCLISQPWEKMNKGETLLYASYPLLEVQRQHNSWLTAYSAAVSLDDSGILLLGKSGAGKTSVAIDLARRYDAKLIGNDLTIIGKPEDRLLIKGGTKFLFLRLTSIRKSLPDLVSLFPGQEREPWRYKIKVKPEDLEIQTRVSPVAVKKIFSLHIDEEQTNLYFANDQKLATKLFLIENFSRYIRGSCINVLGGADSEQLGYIPSYDREELFAFRRDLVEEIIQKIIYISGPLKLVTDYIAQARN